MKTFALCLLFLATSSQAAIAADCSEAAALAAQKAPALARAYARASGSRVVPGSIQAVTEYYCSADTINFAFDLANGKQCILQVGVNWGAGAICD